jgi:hypothetical protein
MGIFKSTYPFSYWHCHMEMVNPNGKTFPFGDFFVDPQMVTNSILERVSDWIISIWELLEEEVPTELKVLLTLTGTLTSLLKHTTEDPAPGCLSRRRIVKMIYFKL